MRFLIFFSFLIGILKDTDAQIVFSPFKSLELIQLETPRQSVITDSIGSSIDSLIQLKNLQKMRNSNLLGGKILGSFFEVVQGGNNQTIQAVFINLDSNRILNDTLIEVLPIGIANRGIYWGMGKHFFQLEDVNVPFLVCILPQDSGKFDAFFNEYSQSPDLQWVEVPQKKDSNQSVFKPISIDEYLMPLPCTHDALYIEYVNDSTLNMTVDFESYNEISMLRCFELLEIHLEHLKRYHMPYCDRIAQVYFGHRNVNMEAIRLFFEKFSELNVQLKIIFSENE